jgi:uncharacterized alpha-E superfamily protein
MSRKAEVPTTSGPMTVAERQRRFREQRTADGWLCLNTLWVEPEAAQRLLRAVEKGESITEVVNRLLKRSRP